MKTTAAIAMLLCAATASAAADAQNRTARTPSSAPVYARQPTAPRTTAAPRTPTRPSTLQSPTRTPSTNVETWSDLDDTSRYLMIMGSADGFSASGAGAPCFPGSDNSSLDKSLREKGFAQGDPRNLAEALSRLSADKAQCQQTSRRGYTMGLLKQMPDSHLSLYLTGLVRAYASVKPCPAANQSYAAATVTAAIFSSRDDAQPADVIAPAIAEGCRGVPR